MPVPAGSSPPPPPSSGPLYYDPILSRVRLAVPLDGVVDSFQRPYSDGWGDADSGQAWVTSGGAPGDYHVNGFRGVFDLTTTGIGRQAAVDVTLDDVDLFVGHVKVPVAPLVSNVELELRLRYVDNNNYVACRLYSNPANTVTINLLSRSGGVETATLFPGVPGATAASELSVHVQAVGSVFRARAWLKGQPEPTAWQVTLPATHHTPGAFQWRATRTTGNTNTTPYYVELDDLTVTPMVTVWRSADQIRWTAVRGGTDIAPVNGAIRVDDYEFAPDVPNWYRVSGLFTGSIAPFIGGVWLKSLARPYLNRKVTVRDFSEVSRRARAGVFDVVARSVPVAVTDVRGSRQWSLDINTYSARERSDLDMLLASGDILLVHVPPAAGRISATPGGYVTVGDTREVIPPTVDLLMRVFSLPCVEAAAPGPDVVGTTITCQGVLDMYATCAAVLAAHPTCVSLLELIGDPTDVIVS